jgi:hypothetical protein
MRHPTRAAIDRLSDCFGLVLDHYMQDWEIECADPTRVREFLDFYAAGTANDDERFTLMAMILGSFEEYHGLHEPDSAIWERIRSVLTADIDLHRDQIEYYQCLDAESEEEHFPITKLIRQINIPARPVKGAVGTPH